MNEKGGTIQTAVIEHSQAGFAKLEALRQQLQVEPGECIVGMETAHSLLIDHLWASGYEAIYVLPRVLFLPWSLHQLTSLFVVQ
ncbi:MAG: hypothetical protein HY328_05100 [Chloroflexi bacterium]|nr:hypothetical protein [Chloroflexota bacterium]